MTRLYLDHAATSPLDPVARDAMAPWLEDRFGNPSSLHQAGRRARAAIDEARETVAKRLGCRFAECLFTSGGTESAHMAILGVALCADPQRRRVILGAAEHHCVLGAGELAARLGLTVETAPVDRRARLDPATLGDRLGPDVLLVAAMHANNELGTINPIEEIAAVAHDHGALLFVDAVQTLGGDWTVDSLGADLLAVSAHKIGGPKGVGALYIRAGTPIEPLQRGGGQEREMRAGTENVAGIVGFAAAVRRLAETPDRRRQARDAFLDALAGTGAAVTAEGADVLAGHAHVRFPGLSAESLLIVLDRMGVEASSGAACASGSLEPSHVMLACGYSDAEAREGLRFTFGRSTEPEDAREAARRLLEAVSQVKAAQAGRQVN
jgi:cysteine desulfurase